MFFPFLFGSFRAHLNWVNYFLWTLCLDYFYRLQPQTFGISVILCSIEYILIFKSNSILFICVKVFSIYCNRKRPYIFHRRLFVHDPLLISVIVIDRSFISFLLIIDVTCYGAWSQYAFRLVWFILKIYGILLDFHPMRFRWTLV